MLLGRSQKGSGAWHTTSGSHMKPCGQSYSGSGRSPLWSEERDPAICWTRAFNGDATPKVATVVVPDNRWIISPSCLRGRPPRLLPATLSETSLSTNCSPACPCPLLSRAPAETTSRHQQHRISPLTTTGLATPEALMAWTPYVKGPGDGDVSIQRADRKGSGVRRSSGMPP